MNDFNPWVDDPILGNRMSALPVTEFCGHSATLGDESGSGRSAAMSTWFHAECSGKGQKPALTPEELEEVKYWVKPDKVTLPDTGEVLLYSEADTELEVTLEFDNVVSVGHLDFAWVVRALVNVGEGDEARVAYVADIKRGVYTASDGPDSLQLHAYGQAYAKLHNCDFYVTGIYVAEDGEWFWSSEMVEVGSEAYEAKRERLHLAVTNVGGQPSTGSHCRQCWNRLRCSAHVLAGVTAVTDLAPVCDGGQLTSENALKVLLAAEAALDVGKRAKDAVQAWVAQGNTLEDPSNGKVYKPVPCRGRESVSVGDLRKELGPLAEKHIKRGASFMQHRWVKS